MYARDTSSCRKSSQINDSMKYILDMILSKNEIFLFMALLFPTGVENFFPFPSPWNKSKAKVCAEDFYPKKEICSKYLICNEEKLSH